MICTIGRKFLLNFTHARAHTHTHTCTHTHTHIYIYIYIHGSDVNVKVTEGGPKHPPVLKRRATVDNLHFAEPCNASFRGFFVSLSVSFFV